MNNDKRPYLAKISHDPSWLVDLLFLLVILIIFYTLWLGSYPLFTPDESRYSEIAREMVATNDYITPRLDGVAFLDKPVLYYWLQALAIQLFDVKEWALRLFPALFGVLGSLGTYICGRRLFNRRTGVLSAIILATTPLYFAGAHFANLDLEVAVLISCTLLCLMISLQTDDRYRSYFLLAAYCLAALAVLTKGLIGMVFPVLVGGTWIVLLGHWAKLKKIRLFSGLMLFTAIILPWYILVQKANPEFLHYFFVTQQITRFLSVGEFNNKTPFWFYLPVILIGFFPWSIFLLQAMNYHIRQVWRAFNKHPAELFLLIWSVIVFFFFSIPHSKTLGYIQPLFPALALLVGNYLSIVWSKAKQSLFCMLTACSVIMLLTLILSASSFNNDTVKPLVLYLKSIIKPGDEVINYYRYYQDVPLYLGKTVTIVADWNAPDIASRDNWTRELWYGMRFQNTDDWLIDDKTFWRRWDSQKRVFVFMHINYFALFQPKITQYFLLGKYNDVVLISNLRSK